MCCLLVIRCVLLVSHLVHVLVVVDVLGIVVGVVTECGNHEVTGVVATTICDKHV